MYNTVISHSDGDERRDPGPAGLVGSGKAVGGVVSDVSIFFNISMINIMYL